MHSAKPLAAGLVGLAASALIGVSTAAAQTYRILTLGDSITATIGGAGYDGSYQKRLKDNLTAAGYSYVLVGPNGTDPNKHGGFSGQGLDEVRSHIVSDLNVSFGSSAPPSGTVNVVFLMLGINEMNHGYGLSGPGAVNFPPNNGSGNAAAVAPQYAAPSNGSYLRGLGLSWGSNPPYDVWNRDQVQQLLTTILNHASQPRVIVGSVLPVGYGNPNYRANTDNCVERIKELNQMYVDTVNSFIAAGRNIRYVDNFTAANRAYGVGTDFGTQARQTIDWVHPDAGGVPIMQTIGNNFFTAFQTSIQIATPGLTAERWNNVTGTTVGDALNAFASGPASTTSTVSTYRTAINSGDNYAQRVRGFIVPPVSGYYTFYLASDAAAELHLSTNGNRNMKVKINEVLTTTNPDAWTTSSVPVYLTAGARYFTVVWHKEGSGADHMSVGWKKPGDTTVEVVPNSALRVWTGIDEGPGGAYQITGSMIGFGAPWGGMSSLAMDKALDGITTTSFVGSAANGNWVGLDCGTPKRVISLAFHSVSTRAALMVGGRFQGANQANFSDAVDLHVITTTPADNAWTGVSIFNASTFRYLRYLSPDGSYGNIAELGFWGY